MPRFPEFMKSPLNHIARGDQHTRDIEGWVFDGADGSQMVYWESNSSATTAEHAHAFDEYFIVVEGAYHLTLDGEDKTVSAGEECFIPKGTKISGHALAGTRTIHAFGGHRANRDTVPSSVPPYLPEQAPLDPAPAKPTRTRTFAIWVILVLGFWAIWQVLPDTSDPNADSIAPGPRPSAVEDWLFWTPLILLALLALMLGWFVRKYAATHRFNATQEPGCMALAERRFDEAIQLIGDTERQYRNKPLLRSVVQVSRGHASMWAGRLDEAIAAYTQADRGAGVVLSGGIRVLAAGDLAILYALVGDTNTAERWVTETRRRLTKNGDDRLALAARVTMADGLIACQKRDYHGALCLLENRRLLLRHSLPANLMRIVEVVCAFAAARSEHRDAQNIHERLLRVAPTSPREFAFLGARWPEMRTFLAEHRLLS